MNDYTELANYLTRVEPKKDGPYLKPRDAATLILLDRSGEEPRVLFGKRSEKHAFMPGMFVFPGGGYDPVDARVRVTGELDPFTGRRLLQGSPKITANRARALALAAIRETCEETGILIGRRDSNPIDVPSPAWQPFRDAGIHPDVSALFLIARAITPPGRPRRFDTRFFVAERQSVAKELPGIAGPEAELVELRWLPLGEARKERLPAITKVILEELENRLKAGFPKERAAPFFYARNGKFHCDELT